MSTAHLECGPALPWAKAEENPKPANFPPEDIASLGLKAGDKIEIYWTVHYEDEDKEDEPRWWPARIIGQASESLQKLEPYKEQDGDQTADKDTTAAATEVLDEKPDPEVLRWCYDVVYEAYGDFKEEQSTVYFGPDHQLVDMRNKDLPVSYWRKDGEEYEVPEDDDDGSEDEDEEGVEDDAKDDGDDEAAALTLDEVLQAGYTAEENGQLVDDTPSTLDMLNDADRSVALGGLQDLMGRLVAQIQAEGTTLVTGDRVRQFMKGNLVEALEAAKKKRRLNDNCKATAE